MNGNRAPDGAAIYISAPTDGASHYCNFYGNDLYGSATINGNNANQWFYSIVSGNGVPDVGRCTFGLFSQGQPPTHLTATNNSSPLCRPQAVRSNSSCPRQ